ncbi:MAG TPA: L-rhamnose mutarotase [Paraburkholderia sp.]|uniref:L-rhamnose mutarotase n=1 Tax=Paraburkholderia sp. TaxID=1926495 RepID=UPI002ED58D52
MTHRHCFALDLIDQSQAVEAYEAWHRPGKTPAEVITFFRNQGVEDLQIFRAGNRLFMILDLCDEVSAEDFANAGNGAGVMKAWEDKMSAYQQPIVFGSVASQTPSQSWVVMSELFNFKGHL